MINNTALQLWERLAAKQLDQMFKQRIIDGLNCSPFEADAILQNVHDTYAAFFQCAPGLQPGQLSLQVVSIEAPPGPRLTHCPQILVTLTWEDSATDLPARKKGGVAACNVARFSVDPVDKWSVLEAPWLVRCWVMGMGGMVARF